MAGTPEGAKKAAETNKKKYGENFYAQIGSRSWDDPDRSRETGFALMPPELRKKHGANGGRKNKGKKYAKKTEEYETVETLSAIFAEDEGGSPGVS